jgi:hypothetical protein
VASTLFEASKFIISCLRLMDSSKNIDSLTKKFIDSCEQPKNGHPASPPPLHLIGMIFISTYSCLFVAAPNTASVFK